MEIACSVDILQENICNASASACGNSL